MPSVHRSRILKPTIISTCLAIGFLRCTVDFSLPEGRSRGAQGSSLQRSALADSTEDAPRGLLSRRIIKAETDFEEDDSDFVTRTSRLIANRRSAIGLVGSSMAGGLAVHPAFGNAPGNWNYDNKGTDWGLKFPDCDGNTQTPIDLSDKISVSRGTESLIRFVKYTAMNTVVYNSFGRTVQVNGNFGTFNLPDGPYVVRQFHFHFPSEHAVDGKLAAGEMHIVHQKEGSKGTDDLAVIGMFMKHSDCSDGPEGLFLKKLGFGIGLPPDDVRYEVNSLDLNAFASQLGGSYFHYQGSLTTPPCSETVHWYVCKRGIPVTDAMIDSFKVRFPANNRLVLPLNGRKLVSGDLVLPKEY